MIEHAIDLLLSARHVVALTGAGLSTHSGIPDFRSRDTGLWANYNPMEIATVQAFRHRTVEFFNWIRPLVRQIVEAQPNAAHRALVDLAAADRLSTVITQNIDGLHQRAGLTDVVELHGNIYTATCVRCYRVFASDQFVHALIDEGRVPVVPAVWQHPEAQRHPVRRSAARSGADGGEARQQPLRFDDRGRLVAGSCAGL